MELRKTLPRPTLSYFIRDHYREQHLKEMKDQRKKEFNYRRGIVKRSIRKFSTGPFARNHVAQNGVEQDSELFKRFNRRRLSRTAPRRKSEDNSNNRLLNKLRREIIMIETNERRLEAALASDKP